MFRTRFRSEKPSRPTALRGSVGSARVWDEQQRSGLGTTQEPVVVPSPLGTLTSPEELAALITGIVKVTLDTRLSVDAAPRRDSLVSELEARLRGVLGLPSKVDEALAREEPAPAPSPAETTEPDAVVTNGRPAPAAPAPAPEQALEQKLASLGGLLSTRQDLRQRLVELALAAPPRRTPPEPDAKPSVEEMLGLDVLQRRAAKLQGALQKAREALAYVSGLERVDPEAASSYRRAQSLAAADPLEESKHDALRSLFESNVALQKRQR